MHHYLLIYELAPNYLEERTKFRKEHLALANENHKNGNMILGGALDNPADQAILIFKCGNEEDVKHFVRRDPYVQNGLVKKWHIRKWNVVVGDDQQ